MSAAINDENLELPPANRRKQALAQVVVLSSLHCWSIVSPMFGDSYAFNGAIILQTVIQRIITRVSTLALILFVMLVSGDPLEYYGYRKPKWAPEIAAFGLVAVLHVALIPLGRYLVHVFPANQSATAASYSAFLAAEKSTLPTTPLWVLAVYCVLVALAEESFYRGFLMVKLQEISGSIWIALVMQSLFFGLVHSYQGFGGMLTVALSGLIYGFAFMRVRAIWPIALVHALYDFWFFYRLWSH